MLGMNYDEAEEILTCVMDRLQRERERRGLSLQKLGAISGVSRIEIGLIKEASATPA